MNVESVVSQCEAGGQGASTLLFLGGVREQWWRELCEGWSKLH